MPLVQTRGAASAQGFGEFAQAAGPAVYVEDVFQTWLYTGTGSAITINNGVDLSGKGGLVWFKTRTGTPTGNHYLIDTVRGNNKLLVTTVTDAQDTDGTLLTAFNSTGFSVGTNGVVNTNTRTYASWTFREAPKFFDIVTGTGGATFNHSLGVTPGMVIIKLTSGTSNWWTVHRSSNGYFYLNDSVTAAGTGTPGIASTGAWVNANSTTFSTAQFVSSGESFVAYLFAHNAGGFGAAGTDNVISCGSFTANASGGYSVNLGYEAQYVLLKRTSGTGNWLILDVMRGAGVAAATTQELKANLVAAEITNAGNLMSPSATGFGADTALSNLDAGDYIYVAIRRPMKPPTSGTQVFNTNIETTATNPQTLTTGFPVDLSISTRRSVTTSKFFVDRLRGSSTTSVNYSTSNNTNAETNLTSLGIGFDNNTGIVDSGWFNESGAIFWSFRRASGFFDEVCYTGTGTQTAFNHNLTVAPELVIIKKRNVASTLGWVVGTQFTSTDFNFSLLNSSDAGGVFAYASVTTFKAAPTTTTFTLGTYTDVNASASTYVAYLFATLAGVSKVGSYTGNGGTQAIACGFTSGARFVLIKRTDATGDWYVYDTARGMTLLTDPYLLLNSTAAETATLGSVTTTAGGFTVDATILAAINTNAASYIFLAIA